jgi:iron complex transport system substrate-binding protein
LGDAVGSGAEADPKVSVLRRRLTRVEEVNDRTAPRVDRIEWLGPPFSAGHWVPEMVRMGGGEDFLSETGEFSGRISWKRFSKLRWK